MITRREALAGFGGFALAGALAGCATPIAADGFVCTTTEGPLLPRRTFRGRTAPERAAVARAVERGGLTVYGTTYFADRWRLSDGNTPDTGVITLGVHVDNASAADRWAIVRHAADWARGDLGRRVRFDFTVPRSRAQIRVHANGASNQSKVGRQCLAVPADQPTMTLQTADARAVRHEFGHALGLRHEHHHPNSGIIWRERVVIEYMRRNYGWSEQMTRREILNRYGQEAACIDNPAFDRVSVMLYPILREWTTNFSSGTNTEISARDRACLGAVYEL